MIPPELWRPIATVLAVPYAAWLVFSPCAGCVGAVAQLAHPFAK